MNIAITYNLCRHKPNLKNDREAEFDSRQTIRGLQQALEANQHRVSLIEADDRAYIKLKALKSKIDLVFNIAEGKRGEAREAQIPAMLELLSLPYTGSGPLTLAVCLDKELTKRVLESYGLPTAPWQLFNNTGEPLSKKLKFPLFIKPNSEGSSRGIMNDAIIKNKKQLYRKIRFLLRKYRQAVLVENYLPGREFTVSVLGNAGQLRAFPVVEPRFSALPKIAQPFDSYESKHLWPMDWNAHYFNCPAKIKNSLAQKMKGLALDSFRALNCRDFARVDIRLDQKGNPQILEINPIPAISRYSVSDLVLSASVIGLDYTHLIGKIVQLARLRCRLNK